MKNKYALISIALLLAMTAFFTVNRITTSLRAGGDYASSTGTEITTEDIAAPPMPSAEEGEALTISFSESEAFHTEAITVTIAASNPYAEIFYTLNGTVPTRESREYSSPLQFNRRGRFNGVTLRAIAVYGDYTTAPLTQTFFIGPDIHNRFETMVFSLTTNPDYLFDHDIGIFVEGALREQFLRDNPGRRPNPPDLANFNMRGMEAERPTHLEVFSPCGERLLAQEIGVRTHGGWSRGHSQKSIRLVPRRIYTPETGQFRFDFFPGDLAYDGSNIERYDQLVLRNAGNDRDHGMIRNELGSILIRNAGFLAVTPVQPAAIFINGRYYGFAWLNVRFNEQYMQALYNAPTRYFDIVGMGERWIVSDDPQIIADLQYKNGFAYRDLRDDATFAELEALVDIDNLLFYYAFQIFAGQEDWPHNNLRRWRYTGPQEEGLAPELDGRWRYVAFDLDWTFGLYGDNYTKPTFQRVIEADPRSPLLAAILQRQDMADRFTMIMNDIAANVVNEETVTAVIDDLIGASRSELDYAIRAGTFQHWFNMGVVDRNVRDMIHFAQNRETQIFGDLIRFFGFEDEMFTVEVIGGEAIIGSVQATSSRYFAHLTVPVRPVIPYGMEFSHWVLNGIHVYEKDITVSVNDGPVVQLELVTR